MKRLLTLLFFAFFAITTQAQTVPNLPQGVVPFGTQLWRAPDGDIWTGNEFEGYTNLGNWQRVADSLQVKINWSDTTIIASKEWVEGKLNSLPPSGVLTVTGDGVDNTDPANPVLSYPDPADIGALAPGDNISELVNDVPYLTTETDPVYSGDPASGITQNDIDRWDDKQDAITGAATTVVQNNLTPSRALISNGSGKIAVSPVSSTELAFLDGVSSNIQDQLDAKIPLAQKGASDGVAPLGPDGKVPNNYLNFTGYTPKGSWDASTNTPTLADGAGTIGWVYTVSVAGTQDLGSGSVSYNVGDRVVYTADNIWVKEENTQLVVSVNGYQGVVNLNKADVGLGNVDNTSDLDKPISNAVQDALDLKLDASEISNYYTKTQMQTSGQSQVHWDNITNVPGDLGVQTLSLGSNSGEISISGGNNIRLTDLFSRSSNSFDDFTRARGFFPYNYLSTATGYVGGLGGTGIRSNRSGTSYVGAFDIIAPSAGTPRLMFNVGSGAETWTGWRTFASEEWVTGQINTSTTLNSVLSNSAISSVVAQADNNFSINLKPPAESGWDRWFGFWQPNKAETGFIGGAFGMYGVNGNAGINYAYLVTDLNNTISNMGGRNSPGLRVYPTGQNGLRYYYDSSEKQVWHEGNLDPSALSPETVISTTVNFTIDWQNDTAPGSGGKTYAEVHGNHFVYSAFYTDGSGAEVNYSPAVKITRSGGNITTVQFGDIQTGNIVIK